MDGNNNNKRKEGDSQDVLDFRTPASSLRNVRRRTICHGPGGSSLPLQARLQEPRSRESEHVGRFDVDEMDHIYQRYVSALGWKLAVQNSTTRSRSKVQHQLAALENKISDCKQRIVHTEGKILQLTALCETHSLLTNVEQEVLPALKDQSSIRQCQTFCDLGSNVKKALNALKLQGLYWNEDDIQESSDRMFDVNCGLKDSGTGEDTKTASQTGNTLDNIVKSRLDLEVEHKSLEQIKDEANTVLLKQFSDFSLHHYK